MLSRINRLTKKDGLEEVCKRGKTIKKDCLLIKYRENGLSVVRLAFVASKKIAPRANKRNLLKRRLRNAARQIINDSLKGKDIVVFTLKGAENNSYSQLKEKLQAILMK